MGYAAFVLDEHSRERLLNVYKPKHENVITHHVTIQFGITEEQFPGVCRWFNNATHLLVRGYADRHGVDCVAVIVEGQGNQKDSKTILHVTLSCSEGVKPVMAKYPAAHVMEGHGYMVLSGSIQYFN